MKSETVQGIILARAFIAMHQEDKGLMTDNLKKLLFLLDKEVRRLILRTKINPNKQVMKAYDKFQAISIDGKVEDEIEVKGVPFALRLLYRIPNKEKYKQLVKIALDEDKNWKFSSDENVKNAKYIVDRFYGLIKE